MKKIRNNLFPPFIALYIDHEQCCGAVGDRTAQLLDALRRGIERRRCGQDHRCLLYTSGHPELAKGNTDNLLHMVRRFGKVYNLSLIHISEPIRSGQPLRTTSSRQFRQPRNT